MWCKRLYDNIRSNILHFKKVLSEFSLLKRSNVCGILGVLRRITVLHMHMHLVRTLDTAQKVMLYY